MPLVYKPAKILIKKRTCAAVRTRDVVSSVHGDDCDYFLNDSMDQAGDELRPSHDEA